MGVRRHRGGIVFCLLVGLEDPFLVAESGDEIIAYLGERLHLVLVQFREEDLAALAQEASEHAYLSTLGGRDEIASDVGGSGERLFLHDAFDPSGRQASVAESDVGETSGCHGEEVGISHDEILHDSFACPHDIDGVCRLVGRDAEEMSGWELGQQVE